MTSGQTVSISTTGTQRVFPVFRSVEGGATGNNLFNLNYVEFNGPRGRASARMPRLETQKRRRLPIAHTGLLVSDGSSSHARAAGLNQTSSDGKSALTRAVVTHP